MFLFDKDGRSVEVEDPQQIAQALSAGNLLPTKGRTTVIREGSVANVDNANLLTAIQQGWAPETKAQKAERKYGERSAEAAAAGFARGATLGLSDVALTKTGIASPETLRGLKAGSPGLSTAAEVAGAVAPAFVSGGGTAGKLAAATPSKFVMGIGAKTAQSAEAAALKFLTSGGKQAGLAKRALARGAGFAAGGSVEGAAYALGTSMSEHSLGEVATVGEALAANIGPMAIGGGIAGGLLGSGSYLGGRALKAATRAASSKLEKGLSATVAEAEKQAANKPFAALGMKEKELGKAFGRPHEAAGVYQAMDEQQADIARAILKEADIAATPGREAVEKAAVIYDDLGGKLRAELDQLDNEAYFFFPEKFRQRLHSVLKGEMTPGGTQIVSPSGTQVARQKARDPAAFHNAMMGTEKKPGLYQEVLHSTRSHSLVDVFDTIRGLEARKLSGVKAEARDEVVGALKMELRESLSDPVLEKKFLQQLDAFEAMSRVIKNIPGREGAHAQSLLKDFIQGAGRGAAIRVAMGQNLAGAVMRGMAYGGIRIAGKMLGGRGTGDVAGRLGKLRQVQKAVEETGRRVDLALERVISAPRAGPTTAASLASAGILQKVTGKSDRQEAAKELTVRLNQMALNPAMTADLISMSLAGLEDDAPETSVQASAVVGRAMNVLAQYSPDLPPEVFMYPKMAFAFDEGSVDTFAAAIAAIEDFTGLVDEVSRGVAHPVGIEVAKQVFPELVARVREQVVDAISQRTEPLPPTIAAQIGDLFGVQLDPLATPQALVQTKLALAPGPRAQNSPKMPGAQQVRMEGVDKADDIAKNWKTQPQRLGGDLT